VRASLARRMTLPWVVRRRNDALRPLSLELRVRDLRRDSSSSLCLVLNMVWSLEDKMDGLGESICISDLVFGELNGVFPLMLRGCEYGGVVLNRDMVGVC
jgi:hypothetical protein